MAEFVELRTEDMIPELEQMEKLSLMQRNEIKNVLQRRKDYEYKLLRHSKSKQDFLNYIEYEYSVMKLVEIRRLKLGMKNRTDIERSILSRINFLYNTALVRFRNDAKLWISYLQFIKKEKFSKPLKPLLEMLKMHHDKPELFMLAADWEFESNESILNARQILLRGIHFHPKCLQLYSKAYEFELQHADNERELKKEYEENGEEYSTANEEVMNGLLAEVIYKNALKNINSVAVIINLLGIAKKFSFTKVLQLRMVNDMLSNYVDEEDTWDTMAKRELEGLPNNVNEINNEEKIEDNSDQSINDVDKRVLKNRIRCCAEVYKVATEILATDKMWSMYIDTIIKLKRANNERLLVEHLLRKALKGAHVANCLTSKNYLLWIKMLESGKLEKLSKILKGATEKHPTDIELWEERLKCLISLKDEGVGNVLLEATKCCKENSISDLWEMVIKFYEEHFPEKLQELFENCPSSVRPLYLQWIYSTKGISETRKMYNLLSIQAPFVLDMHRKMISIEELEERSKERDECVRRCHELACSQFGTRNIDVWMDYIKFEHQVDNPTAVSKIHWKATKELDQNLIEGFAIAFNIYKYNCD